MPALAELEAAWVAARDDAGFRAELDGLLRDYVGRPSPLYLADRPQRGRRPAPSTSSARTSTTPARTRSTTPSARRCWPSAWASRASSPRPARASTASPPPPPARCSDLECVVYMGIEDIRRQEPNVQRMELLGATVVAGRGRRAHAQGGGRRRRSATGSPTSPTTHYIIGSAVGPAPYPAIVRDLQRVIGDEARAQILEREGRLPDRVIACVGGGSNAIGMFAPFVGDEGVELVGVEAAGEALEPGRHGAPLTVAGRPGVLHGVAVGGAAGRDGPDPRGPLDLGRPGLSRAAAPSTPTCATRAARATWRSPTPRRSATFRRVDAAGGDHPGARDRARPALRARSPPTPSSTSCAARAAATRTWPRSSAHGHDARPTGAEAIAAAFAGDGRARGADALHDGRLPRHGRRRGASARPTPTRGADLVELGVPFPTRWPTARSSTPPAPPRCAPGRRRTRSSPSAAALAERVPVVAMVYANLVHRPRPRALRRRPRRARASPA